MALAIKINAGNDRNGNPRRGWIIADDHGRFVDFVDEGYSGSGALRVSPYVNFPSTDAAIDVLPSTYKDALRQSKSNDIQRDLRIASHLRNRRG